MIQDILYNIIANVISTVLCTIPGLILLITAITINRQHILRFFGINQKKSVLRIYVSRLEIKPRGTIGIEPIEVGYSGPAINQVEYQGALLIREALKSKWLSLLPNKLQDWLGNLSFVLMSVDPPIEVSPQQEADISYDNLVILGSSIYNLASKCYMEHPSCAFYFTKNESGERVFRIRDGGLKDIELPGRSQGQELGIIQRIKDNKHGTVVFICAGLGTSATYGSARYLIENWRSLQRKYHDADFSIFLAFKDQPRDSAAVVQPRVIYEFHSQNQH